ncbi:MAG: acetylornithine transaminase [Campylobacterales bacterium]|nr:acetylornithine transaminase [Campylobacterales bacterium]
MTKELEQLDKEYVLPTYGRNYVNFVKGDNATLFDENGKDYIDFTSGIGVVSAGHGNKRVGKKIAEQVGNITHISNLFLIEPQAKLAEKIVKLSGYDMRCFFANSGAEANEGAIKIARKYGELNGEQKKYKIITLVNSFHGRTISSLKATGQPDMHQTYFGPYPDGFIYAKDLDEVLSLVDDKTAGVMIELIQGEGGVTALDKDKVQKLAEELKKRDVLLIIDEVQTGGYRTGEFLASNAYEIDPDIITLAKGIGGGVPIGVVMTKHKDVLSPGDHGSTFGGNYLSTAASLEVLEILEEEYKKDTFSKNIEIFDTYLKGFAEKFDNLFDGTSGNGLIRGLGGKSAETQQKVITEAFNEGVLVLKAGKNRVRFLPPLTITEEEIKEGMKRFEKALTTI